MVIKLRWVTYRNSVSYDEIQNYRNSFDVGVREAKRFLEDKREVLEYLDENDQWWPVEQVEITRVGSSI